MRRSHRFALILLLVITILILKWLDRPGSDELVRGEYVGHTVPDSLPDLFAPGVVSQQFNERDAAFTPDGREFYYTLWTGTFGVILVMRQSDGQWSPPQIASFSGTYSDMEPFVTSDGRYLYFASNRPETESDARNDYNIWRVQRHGADWDTPQPVTVVNSEGDEFYPSLSTRGTLYFTAELQDTFGSEDIYSSRFENGTYLPPENLGSAINSPHADFNALIAPDERFLLFSSYGRADEIGGGDLYISFQNEDGWSPARVLPAPINSSHLDYCPALTPDGRYLLFTSRRSVLDSTATSHRSYDEWIEYLSAPGNGNDDIYWMRFKHLTNALPED